MVLVVQVRAQQGLEAAAQALTNYLYYGVTNISDTGVSLIHGEGLKRLEKEGKFISPRLFEAGPTLTAVGGHPIPVNRGLGRTIDTRTLTQIEGPEDAIRQVRRYVNELGVVTIKAILESGGDLDYPRMTLETYTALVDEAHRQGMKVYTHASQLSDARDALEGGVDVIHDAPVVEPAMMDDLTDEELRCVLHITGTPVPTESRDSTSFAPAPDRSQAGPVGYTRS